MKTYTLYLSVHARNDEDMHLKKKALILLAKKLTGPELDTAAHMLGCLDDVNEKTKSVKRPKNDPNLN